ncbi:MAG: MnmC family methyltransferase [Bdellovibrionota bacterium]
MKKLDFDIVTLKSGVKTMRDLMSNEVFHTGIGPMAEAHLLHVEQQRIAEQCSVPGKFIIWDVGLGGAANAIAALDALKGCAADVEIHSFDITRAPTEFALQEAEALEYVAPYAVELKTLLEQGEVRVRDNVRWVYHLGDFRESMLLAPQAQAIFYDPYSSVSNQEVWTLDHLSRMRGIVSDTSLLTNYSASNAVRVTWLMAGFFVGVGVATGKKAETLIASASLEKLERPLDRQWLEKLTRSQSSAPIREAAHEPRTIDAADHALLSAHPQFKAF